MKSSWLVLLATTSKCLCSPITARASPTATGVLPPAIIGQSARRVLTPRRERRNSFRIAPRNSSMRIGRSRSLRDNSSAALVVGARHLSDQRWAVEGIRQSASDLEVAHI